jgi:hypothetical protein
MLYLFISEYIICTLSVVLVFTYVLCNMLFVCLHRYEIGAHRFSESPDSTQASVLYHYLEAVNTRLHNITSQKTVIC